MKLNEALEKVWKAIDKIEDIDFDQTGEEIKEDLLGIHRKFMSNQDGVLDEITNCLQELQEVVDEYKNIEDELEMDLPTLIKCMTLIDKQEFKPIYYNNDKTLVFESWSNMECSIDMVNKCFIEEYRPEGYACKFYFKGYGKDWALTREKLED